VFIDDKNRFSVLNFRLRVNCDPKTRNVASTLQQFNSFFVVAVISFCAEKHGREKYFNCLLVDVITQWQWS